MAVIAANPYISYFWNRSLYTGDIKGVCFPGLHCYSCPLSVYSCPIGALQHAVALLGPKFYSTLEWGFRHTVSILMYVLGIICLTGATIGRMACGWICPFGFLQELIHKIPSKKLKLPPFFRYGKYLALVFLVLAIPFFTGTHWFSRICPVGTLEGGIFLKLVPLKTDIPEAGWFFYLKVFILVFFLIAMVFVKRPFCRSLCPLGALYGTLNRFSLYRLSVSSSKCVKCGKCEQVCPVDISVYDNPNSAECIRCLECKHSCSKDAINSGFGIKALP